MSCFPSKSGRPVLPSPSPSPSPIPSPKAQRTAIRQSIDRYDKEGAVYKKKTKN